MEKNPMASSSTWPTLHVTNMRNQPMRFQRERNSTPMAEGEEIILSSDTDTDDDQLASVGTATSHTPAQQSQSQLATATNDVSFDLITVKKIIERLHVILTRTSNNTVSVDANLLQLEGSWDRLDFGTNCNAERNRAYKKYWEDVLIPRLVHDSDDLLQPILSAIPTDETQLLRRAAAGYVKHTPSSCPSSNEQRTPSSVNSSPGQNSAGPSSGYTFPQTPQTPSSCQRPNEQSQRTLTSSSSRGQDPTGPTRPSRSNTFPQTPLSSTFRHPKRKFLPAVHHRGNTKSFRVGQRIYELDELKTMAKCVVDLAKELQRANKSDDCIIRFLQNSTWSYELPPHKSLLERFNESTTFPKRKGSSLKNRWQIMVKNLEAYPEQLKLPSMEDSILFYEIADAYRWKIFGTRSGHQTPTPTF